MSLESVLWKAFEEDPFGVSACALADWLEEQGEQVAADGVRWMHKFSRRPYRTCGVFGWFDGDRFGEHADQASNLPPALFRRLARAGRPVGSSRRYYESHREAALDLAQALAQLSR